MLIVWFIPKSETFVLGPLAFKKKRRATRRMIRQDVGSNGIYSSICIPALHASHAPAPAEHEKKYCIVSGASSGLVVWPSRAANIEEKGSMQKISFCALSPGPLECSQPKIRRLPPGPLDGRTHQLATIV